MSDRARIVATYAGVEWTAGDVAVREHVMREPAARLAAFRALDPAEIAARIERDGAEQVALDLGVRVSTVRGEAPRVVLFVDMSDAVQAEAPPAAPKPPEASPRRARRAVARMLPVEGERHACTREAACLTEIARLHPNAPGASCPARCPDLAPRDTRAERDNYAASRSGDGF